MKSLFQKAALVALLAIAVLTSATGARAADCPAPAQAQQAVAQPVVAVQAVAIPSFLFVTPSVPQAQIVQGRAQAVVVTQPQIVVRQRAIIGARPIVVQRSVFFGRGAFRFRR